jgi:hypothetical protein
MNGDMCVLHSVTYIVKPGMDGWMDGWMVGWMDNINYTSVSWLTIPPMWLAITPIWHMIPQVVMP